MVELVVDKMEPGGTDEPAPGWYVFDSAGEVLVGPYLTRERAEAERARIVRELALDRPR